MTPNDEIDWEEINARPEKRARLIGLALTLLVCTVAALLLLPFCSIPALFAMAKERKDAEEPPPNQPPQEITTLSPNGSEEARSRDEILQKYGFGSRDQP